MTTVKVDNLHLHTRLAGAQYTAYFYHSLYDMPALAANMNV